jgi:nucleoside-diphosphate-sugar epimerase
VHLGELVGDPACALNERLTLEINLAATRMLAEVAWGYGIKRFIYASSCSVYGATEQVVDEKSDLNPVSLYARAKVGCERALAELGEDFNPVILRLSTVFGLSYRPRFDLVVNLLTGQAVSGSDITIFGGTQYRPFVHVTDVARAILRCLEAPLHLVKGQTFNVGSDTQNHSLRDVGKMIYGLVPESKRVRYDPGEDRRNYRVSFAKIRDQLGFECKVGLERGIRGLAQALRSGEIGDYTSARFSNHKTLSDPTGQPRLRGRENGGWALETKEASLRH